MVWKIVVILIILVLFFGFNYVDIAETPKTDSSIEKPYIESSVIEFISNSVNKSDAVSSKTAYYVANETSKPARKISFSPKMRVIISLRNPSFKDIVINSLENFEYISGGDEWFAGYAAKETIENLKSSSLVEGIWKDKKLYTSTAESFPLINADNVLNQQIMGVSVNGTGYTVCHVDSGIQYNNTEIGGDGNFPGTKVIGGYDYCGGSSNPCGSNDADPIDESGHGTGTAGIIAADGPLYKGIAPGASLAAVKVTANDWTFISNVVTGVDWCVNNADAYNITAIYIGLASPSVSGDYTDCKFPELPLYNRIQQAVNKNITVIAPSGNAVPPVQGDTTGISRPACMDNVISVASVYDGTGGSGEDSFSDWSNRHDILDFLAPGANITSLSLSGLVQTAGTSGAASHMAGAVVLVQDFYKKKYNIILAPTQLKNIFTKTGINITDPVTGMTKPRIDILRAINYEEYPPVINMETQNNTVFFNPPLLEFNATDDHEILNCSLYINGTKNQTIFSVQKNITINFSPSLPEGNYSWNVECFDNSTIPNKGASESRLFTFIIDITPPTIQFVPPTTNSGNVSSIEILANITSTDSNLDTISVFLFNSTQDQINTSASTTSPLYINFTNLPDGIYYLNATANDTYGNINQLTRTIQLDTIQPTTSASAIKSDSSSYIFGTATSSYINVTLSCSDTSGCNTTLYCTDTSNSCAPNTPYSSTIQISAEGISYIRYYSNDSAGNTETTDFQTMKIDTILPAIIISSPSDNSFLSQSSVSILGTASDSNPDTVVINDTRFGINQGTYNSWNFTNSSIAEGTYSVLITATDTAGNSNSQTLSFIVDIIPPTIQFVSPTETNNTYVARTILLSNITSSDTNLDTITSYLYNSTSMVQTNISSTSPLFINFTGLPDGTYYLNGTSNDSAGNTVTLTARTVTIDTISSSVTANPTSYPLGQIKATNGQTITLNATITDTISGIQTVTVDASGLGCSSTLSMSPQINNIYTVSCILSGTTTGTKLLTVNATDYAGNSNIFVSLSVEVDATKPTIKIHSPTNTTYYTTTIDFNVSADETIDAWWYTLNGTNITFTPNITISPVAGFNILMVYANDSAGNENSTTMYFTVNLTQPTSLIFVPLTEPNNSNVSRDWYYVNLTFSDNNPDSCLLEVGGTNYTMTRSGTNCYINRTSQSDGTYVYKAYVNDTTGNIVSSASWTIFLDTTNPTATANSTQYPGGQTYAKSGDSVTVRATLIDSGTGIKNATIPASNICTATVALTNSGSDLWTGTCAIKSSPTEGSNNIPLTVYDYAGNLNSSVSLNILVDDSLPTADFTSPANGSYLSQTYIGANLTSTDSISGITNSGLTIYLYNTTNQISSNTSSTSPFFQNFTGLSDGTYYLNASAYDNAMNMNTSETRTITLDTTPPYSIIYQSPTPANNTNQSTNSYTVNITFTETNPDTCLFDDGSTNTTMTRTGLACSITLTGQSDGTKTYRVWVNDTVGNLATSSTQTVIIDTANPSVVLNSPSDLSTNTDGSVTLNTTVSDINLANVSLYFNGILNQTNTSGINGDYIFTFTLSDATYNWSILATDTANNQNQSETRTFTVSTDSTAPLISYGSSTTETGNQSQSYIEANITSTDSNLDTISVFLFNSTQDQINTSASTTSPLYINFTNLPDGIYYLNATANDSYGNINQLKRTIQLDTIQPTTSASAIKSNSSSYIFGTVTSSYINVTLSCSDTSGCNTTLYCTDTSNSCAPNTSYSSTIQIPTEGISYIRYYSNDSAGNTETTDFQTMKIDTILPAIIISSPSDNSFLSQSSVSILGTASDSNPDTVVINDTRFGTNQGNYTNWNFTNSSIAEGTYSVLITATDTAGNSNSQTLSFIVDINQPPVAFSASMNPSIAYTNTLFTCVGSSTDPDGDTLTEYYLFRNSTDILQNWSFSNTFNCSNSECDKDNILMCEYKVSDDLLESTEVQSQPVAILNSPPDVSAQISQTSNQYTNTLFTCVGSSTDPDGDTLTEYYLFRNSTDILQNWSSSNTFDCSNGCRKDEPLVCEYKASDSFSETMILDSITISNTAPVIISTPVLSSTEGVLYAYDVDAVDAENDILTYSLVSSPKSMSIDSNGNITWLPSISDIGNHTIVVLVSDDKGGGEQQEFTIKVEGLPDLRLKDLRIIYPTQPNTYVQTLFYFVIKNIGSGTAKGVEWKIDYMDGLTSSPDKFDMKAGEEIVVVDYGTFINVGSHLVTATSDPSNIVTEISESNNMMSITSEVN